MSNVDLIATKSFSYATRRLKAGDSFTVSERMAKVLIGINKAQEPRPIGSVPAPPADMLQRVQALAPQTDPEPVTPARPDPLDHDGDGKRGGSRKGARRRRTAKKG